jgi:transforming growth factor-beta-induced protein
LLGDPLILLRGDLKMIRVILTSVVAIGVAFPSMVSRLAGAETAGKKDIVETAMGAEQFKTLVKGVKAAELVDVLKGEGPFTVFAPTDEAFAKVPKEQMEALLKDKAQLQTVLTYHVVPGKVMAADVVKLKSAETAEGKPVKITVEQGKVKINDSNVVKTDIECSNGVIHVIDAVLLPPSK